MNRSIVRLTGSLLFGAALAISVVNAQDKGKGDATKGKDTFEQCAMCHNVDSPDKKMGPSLQGLFKHKTMANGKPVTDENVTAQINNGGNGMPGYADMLSAEEKTNLLAYLHTL